VKKKIKNAYKERMKKRENIKNLFSSALETYIHIGKHLMVIYLLLIKLCIIINFLQGIYSRQNPKLTINK
jgi:hypothetical protein